MLKPVEINIKLIQKTPQSAFQGFYWYHIENSFNEKENQQIIQKIKESNLAIINVLNESKNDILIGFNKTIIHAQNSSKELLQPLFSENPNIKFIYLQNNEVINNDIDIDKDRILRITDSLDEEIKNFSKWIRINHSHENPIYQMRRFIESCISGYLIGESYFKLIEEQKKILFPSCNKDTNLKQGEDSSSKEWTENEYIFLKSLGVGSLFRVELIYQIETGNLLAIKKPNNIDVNEITKLNKREYKNYLMINHPLIPKFYGKQKEDNSLIIQYIHGQTLDTINLDTLTNEDKITIIFELMLIINYLHDNNFVYRDLKPNNVIINENKTVFLIDFDRMININTSKNGIENITIDFSSYFVAPEVNLREITYKNDIYSLGKMIEYVKLVNDKRIDSIYNKYINNEPNKRPSISKMICEYCSIVMDKRNNYNLGLIYYEGKYIERDINKSINYFSFAANQNYLRAQLYLGLIYYEGKYIERDINKSIHYFSLAAIQNDHKAQYMLGLIYYEDKYIERDINKSIHYFSLAAIQNDRKAQYMLGLIYYEDKYIERDINKSINYFSFAANQNHPDAQLYLGFIYYEGKYIERDINKSIHYFLLTANQNDPDAQFYLGLIYYNGKYIERNINKSIHYFLLASNQSDPDAQFYLGLIYYEGKYIERDINKSINYFSFAANQNHPDAQLYLGLIYCNGKYIERDINKSINYFSFAANQYHPRAQYMLGLIYYEDKYIERDINKSIHYFLLAANQNDPDAQFYLGLIYYNGKYIERDINKSIHYFLLASNQNHPDAQFYLGLIYYEGKYIERDINKSIHYFSFAANQNNSNVQLYLGLIYYEGKYIERDINKSIHYFLLAANQNDPDAQFYLGLIYYNGKYIERDINKSIHYFLLASNQNHPDAQFYLGLIYYEGKYIERDINKSINYFSLAANQNNSYAQFILGNIYSNVIFFKENMIKAIDYFIQSSSNGNINGHFAVGYFYHEGKYVEKNIKKSIHHYKEASTFNNQFAKNNLGIIYRFGCGDEILPNCGLSMDYFEEAIRRFKDKVSMYNLAHIYIYEDKNKSRLNKSIELLIESTKQDFSPSIELLCIALIKLFGFNIDIILKELKKLTEKTSKLPNMIYTTIINKELLYKPNYESFYELFRTINYLYDFSERIISTKKLNKKESAPTKIITGKNITKEFYDGFETDLR